MKKICRWAAVLLAAALLLLPAGCGKGNTAQNNTAAPSSNTRVITDGAGREVALPETVERIVCVNVGALRYTCYLQAQDLVVGVEDYEEESTLSRLYNYVNAHLFAELPVIGGNGEPYPEAIIAAGPDVIVAAAFTAGDADDLQARTGIPVAVVPGSDTTLGEGAYETIRLLGEIYGREDRATELTDYLNSVKDDLERRTAGIPDGDRPSVYVGGVSFKGLHGFAGTEAGYGPLALLHADNLADATGQAGAFDIDTEQVLSWDPDVIFLDYDGLALIQEDYREDPGYYQGLTAVREGRVYAQIPFRSYASNLETALADAYYAATVLYPEEFADVDPAEKAGEIFTALLGTNPYDDLKEAGYAFGPIQLGA